MIATKEGRDKIRQQLASLRGPATIQMPAETFADVFDNLDQAEKLAESSKALLERFEQSLAAHLGTLKALASEVDRAEAAEARIKVLAAENQTLRETISRCADRLGTGAFIAPTATVEFMTLLPGEIEIRLKVLRGVMGRARTILANMALENEGAMFNRWPISHEPLRADAKNLLPIIDETIGKVD